MRTEVTKRKQEIQELFRQFNERGSHLSLLWKGDKSEKTPMKIGLVDSYIVTRVNPDFDANGKMKNWSDFWVMLKLVGYDAGFQHTHTHKIVRLHWDEDYILWLWDDKGMKLIIEVVHSCEARNFPHWQDWIKYRRENRERLEKTNESLLAEHTEFAENWIDKRSNDNEEPED